MTSELLPHLGELADEMCFIHSMTARSNTHGPGETQMGTGFTLEGFPSMGAWVSYALGSESDEMPAFVAIPDPRGVPQTGPASGARDSCRRSFRGRPLEPTGRSPISPRPPGSRAIQNPRAAISSSSSTTSISASTPRMASSSARIASYELAARMQIRAAEVGNLASEPKSMQEMYGVDDPNKLKAGFASNCLLARRLLERGVRFVELFNGSYAMGEGVGNWDGHKTLKEQYGVHGPILDQPAAALLRT